MAENPADKKARLAREAARKAEVKRQKAKRRTEERAARRVRNLAKRLGITPADKRRKNDQKGRHRE